MVRNQFPVLAPKILEILPKEIKNSETLNVFKSRIKNWLPQECPFITNKLLLFVWSTAFPWHETSLFLAIAEVWQKTATNEPGGPLAGFDTWMTVLVNVMGNFLRSCKCGLILRSYPMGCKLFCKSFGTIFRYNKICH